MAARQLQRGCYGVLILCVGWFNAKHAGQWQFVAPGIVLNLLFVSQMVVRFLHRLKLKRMQGDTRPDALAQHLHDAVAMRTGVALATLPLLPLLALASLQIGSMAVANFNLFGALDGWVASTLIVSALISGYWLRRSARSDASSFPGRTVLALAGRTVTMTRALISTATAGAETPRIPSAR